MCGALPLCIEPSPSANDVSLWLPSTSTESGSGVPTVEDVIIGMCRGVDHFLCALLSWCRLPGCLLPVLYSAAEIVESSIK